MRRIRAFLALVSVVILASAMWAGSAEAGGPRRYRVRIVNLTEGQPLTPPVIATHRGTFDLFEVGDLASVGVMQVAENGNVPNLVSALEQATSVAEVVAGAEPLVPEDLPGSADHPDRAGFGITATGHVRFVSFVSMLICTNDGLTGINRVRLPEDVGDVKVIVAAGYDAGTEVNTEDFADIVPPCQSLVGVTGSDPGTGNSNPALLDGGVIHHHPGIAGGVDLVPSVHGWDDPVVRIRITRVN
jgi:Spondin_N